MNSIKWEGLKDWDISDLNFDDWVYDDYPDFHNSHEIWEEIDDLKDANFFLDLSRDQSVSYSRVIASELGGGYIHIRGKMGKTIYSYHVKDKTISLFCLPSPILPKAMCRFGNPGIAINSTILLINGTARPARDLLLKFQN
ncbi:hypothetical protein Tco_0068578 [Tanacetum coccineum]